MILKNSYAFDNQLIELNSKLNDNLLNEEGLSDHKKQYLINKVRADINQKRLDLIL